MSEELNDKPIRYHGFTCPECGSHNFGTHQHRVLFMGNKYPEGTAVGRCHENKHSGNGCEFEWNRDDVLTEDQCIYHQTPEEWMAEHNNLMSA